MKPKLILSQLSFVHLLLRVPELAKNRHSARSHGGWGRCPRYICLTMSNGDHSDVWETGGWVLISGKKNVSKPAIRTNTARRRLVGPRGQGESSQMRMSQTVFVRCSLANSRTWEV